MKKMDQRISSVASFLARDPNKIGCPPFGITSFVTRLISFRSCLKFFLRKFETGF